MKTPTPSMARLASASGMHAADGGARVHTGDDVATDRRLWPAAGNATGNRLLAGLTVGDRALLEPALEPVPLEMRQVLEVPGEPISHIHFVETGLVSMIGVNRADRRIDPRVQNLREILRLFARVLVPDHDNSANHEESERRHSGQKQPADCPPGGSFERRLTRRPALASNPLAELMAEEIFVA